MAKTLITCTVNNVKPTIAAVPAVGTETIDDLGSNQVAIIVGEEANTPAKFFTAVRDMADRFIGELAFQATEPDLTSFTVTLDDASIAPAGTTQANASDPVPVQASLGTITWSSDDELVATVDSGTGEVTGVADGSVNIIGTSSNGGVTAQAPLTVVT